MIHIPSLEPYQPQGNAAKKSRSTGQLQSVCVKASRTNAPTVRSTPDLRPLANLPVPAEHTSSDTDGNIETLHLDTSSIASESSKIRVPRHANRYRAQARNVKRSQSVAAAQLTAHHKHNFRRSQKTTTSATKTIAIVIEPTQQ